MTSRYAAEPSSPEGSAALPAAPFECQDKGHEFLCRFPEGSCARCQVQSARLFAIEDALDSDAWYTPPWIFEGLGVEFDLDVSAPSEPLEWIPARQRYTVADDGLNLPWFGLVWCNPPYSAPTAWCRRWSQHPDGFLLVRADLSTGGPFVAFTAASSIFVPPKRIQFVNGQGGGTGAVNFSSVLLGRGSVADAALARLAARSGGSARQLTRSAA